MEEKQYFLELEEIENKINNNNFKEAEKELQEIYCIKPIRLEWFTLKAKLIYKSTKNYNQIWQTLASKGWSLYNYASISKFIRLYSELNASHNDYSDSNRNRINAALLECSEEEKIECEKIISENINRLEENENKFLSNVNSKEILNYLLEIQDCSFIFENKILYLLITFWLDKMNITDYGKYNYNNSHRKWILNMLNVGYLKEILESEDKETFILLVDENVKDYEVAANIIKKFNKQVFIINTPMEFDVEDKVDLKDTVSISMENAEQYYNDIILINPIQLIRNGENLGDNRDYIIDYICKEHTKDDLVAVITSEKLFDELALRPLMKKRLERLSFFEADYREGNMAFGWAGNYLSYISRIYCLDAKKELAKPSEYKFSIIIPARNSAGILKETLRTCLDLKYQGSYEIVVTDNSTDGNTEVYQLIQDLNDPRINYYKTPRDLHLPKSFEFGFLKAKGEFIFSLGSDDGVLPWTLDVLEEILEKYPDEEIFQWERGAYSWPGFNGGQENKFFIPREYKKGVYNIHKVSRTEYLAKLLKFSNQIYTMPTLYINSGCKRNYLNKIIDKTGRLLDGICQDLYMGVINIAINKEIINIDYPITMVGLSSGSIGYKSNNAVKSIEKANKIDEGAKKVGNIGGFSMSSIERLIPELGTDLSSLYNSILRAIARGVFPMEYLTELLDFKKMFMELYKMMDIRDVYYDKKIHYMRYTASLHGEEFLKWFDDNIYSKALEPRVVDEEKLAELHKKKTYTEGKTELGGMILDASKYGVTNIYEATKLFEKLTGL